MPLNIKEHLLTFVDTFIKLDVPRQELIDALRDQADMIELDFRRTPTHLVELDE